MSDWSMENVIADFEAIQRVFGILTAQAAAPDDVDVQRAALRDIVEGDTTRLFRSLLAVAYFGFDRAATESGRPILEIIREEAERVSKVVETGRAHLRDSY